MAQVIDVKSISNALYEVSIQPFLHLHPTLGAIIKKDCEPGDVFYKQAILKHAEKYGCGVIVREVANLQEAVLAIQSLKKNYDITSIISLSHFGDTEDRVIADLIPMRHDVDTSSSMALGHMITNTTPIFYRQAPCTVAAVYRILMGTTRSLEGMRVGVVGRSLRVGLPLDGVLIKAGATVTCYNSHSALDDLKYQDIVVTATGRPEQFGGELFSPGQTVIDVGVSENAQGKWCGDIRYDEVCEAIGESGKITPVRGGVGLMTTTVLFSKIFLNKAAIVGEYDESKSIV